MEKVELFFVFICSMLAPLCAAEYFQNKIDASNSDERKLICNCGGKIYERKIDWNTAEEIVQHRILKSPKRMHLRDDDLLLSEKCESCVITYEKCYEVENNVLCTSNFGIINNAKVPQNKSKSFGFGPDNFGQPQPQPSSEDFLQQSMKAYKYPLREKVPMGNRSRKVRTRRHSNVCIYPMNLETAELDCKIYPSNKVCVQRCAMGHTLPEGTEVTRTCNKKENKWQPSNFAECKPYVDCGLTLVSGGSFTCTTPMVDQGPQCQVTCDQYEDHEALGSGIHTCDTQGKWEPSLPFCVESGSGMLLVPRPGV